MCLIIIQTRSTSTLAARGSLNSAKSWKSSSGSPSQTTITKNNFGLQLMAARITQAKSGRKLLSPAYVRASSSTRTLATFERQPKNVTLKTKPNGSELASEGSSTNQRSVGRHLATSPTAISSIYTSMRKSRLN